MAKTKLYQIVKQAIAIEWEEDDLITPKEAADLRGDGYVTNIIDMMDSGSLPHFQYLYGVRGKIQKFTSKKAVVELGKVKGGSRGIGSHNKP